MQNNRYLPLALFLGLAVMGCNKNSDAPADEVSKNSTQKTINNEQKPQVEAVIEDAEVVKKQKAMEFALKEDEIKNNPIGQWAISAKASSTYAGNLEDPKAAYNPMQAADKPNVISYNDDYNSWASKEADAGIEWIELDYAKPVIASAVNIRQTYKSGAIIKVELFDDLDAAHTIWQGPDKTSYPPDEIAWLNIAVDKAEYKAKKVKITLATNAVDGWNEIDAVQLVGE